MDGAVAGAVAGSVTTIAMHPLDVAKVRLQLGRNKSLYTFFCDQLNTPLKEIYRGLTPNLIGNAAAWSAYFSIYEVLQGIAFGPSLELTPTPRTHLACSFTAGILSQAATNPIWVIKTRILGSKSSDKGSSSSIWTNMRQIYNHGKLRAFWRGFVPGTMGTVQSALYFSIYGPLKPHLKNNYNLSDTATYFWSSVVAKSVAATIMYPHQVVRSRMQFGEIGLLEAIKSIWEKEMWRGFYSGLSVNLVRVVPAMAITLVTYEEMKKYLESMRNLPIEV